MPDLRATITIADNPDGSFSVVADYHGTPNPQSPAHKAAYLLLQHMDTLGERCVMSESQMQTMLARVNGTEPQPEQTA